MAHTPPAGRATITALADTGCQSCLAGINILQGLNLTIPDLIPVRTKMRSANNADIKLLGAILLHLSGKDAHGRTFGSKQMTYITDRPGMFFLSRRACADLGIISETFPIIGEASSTKPPAQQPKAQPQTTYPYGSNCSKRDTVADACPITSTAPKLKPCKNQPTHE